MAQWFYSLPPLLQGALITAIGVTLASIIAFFSKIIELNFTKYKFFLEEKTKDIKNINEYLSVSFSESSIKLAHEIALIEGKATNFEEINKLLNAIDKSNKYMFLVSLGEHFAPLIQSAVDLKDRRILDNAETLAFALNVRPWLTAPVFTLRTLLLLGNAKLEYEKHMTDNLFDALIKSKELVSNIDQNAKNGVLDLISIIRSEFIKNHSDTENRYRNRYLGMTVDAGHQLRDEMHSNTFILRRKESKARKLVKRGEMSLPELPKSQSQL